MATPNPVQVLRTTKSGVNLADFSDVSLFKSVPQVAEVISIDDALARLGNDPKKLFAVITDGLNGLAVEEARKSTEGWLTVDENGKDTAEVFTGTLVSPEVLNPVVLMLAKLNHGFDEIPKGEKSADLKRAAKEKAMEDIKQSPIVLAGLKKKMEAVK
jgi:hypothetical protein